MVPSVIICVISDMGHGFANEPPTDSELHVPAPLWLCMRPGLATLHVVVGARTQPLLSCITMARMKRSSTPVEDAMLEIADFRSALSSAELLGTSKESSHETEMYCMFVFHMLSKSIQSLWDGQPSLVEPSPLYTMYLSPNPLLLPPELPVGAGAGAAADVLGAGGATTEVGVAAGRDVTTVGWTVTGFGVGAFSGKPELEGTGAAGLEGEAPVSLEPQVPNTDWQPAPQ